jgi:ankyrin repeat protein
LFIYFAFINRTAVALASYYGNAKTLEIILQGGADPFLNDYNGYSPIHWSVWKNNVDCTNLLIQYGASPSTHNFALVSFCLCYCYN